MPSLAPQYPEEITCYDQGSRQQHAYTGYVRTVTTTNKGLEDYRFDFSPGVTKPAGYKPGYVAQICMKFYAKCSHNNTQREWAGCTSSDADAGLERWIYKTIDSATCAQITAQSRTNGDIRNVTCCDTSLCNAPDLTADPTTIVIKADEADTAAADVTCYVIIESWRSSSEAPYAAVPVAFPTNLPTKPSGDEVMTGFWGSFRTHEEAACARYTYVQCDQDEHDYYYADWDSSNIASYIDNPGTSSRWAWVYQRLTMFDCLALKKELNPMYASNVTCCTTDGCNAPIAEVDSVKQQPRTGPAIVLAAETLTCYQSMQLGETISEAVPPAVHPIVVDAQNPVWGSYGMPVDLMVPWYHGTPVCYTAKIDVCKAAGKGCALADSDHGRWMWSYSVTKLSDCYLQQWDASNGATSAVHSVTCCATDLCNSPDAGNDTVTQVIVAGITHQATLLFHLTAYGT